MWQSQLETLFWHATIKMNVMIFITL